MMPGDEGRRPRTLSRRALLGLSLGGAAASWGLSEVSDRAAAAVEDGDSVTGELVRFDEDRSVIIRTSGGAAMTVTLASGAAVYRDGPSALTAFAPGERLTARGRSGARGTWIAQEVQPLYELVETRVTRRDGDEVQTDAGALQVDTQTQARTYRGRRDMEAVSTRDIRAGDTVAALVRHDNVRGGAVVRAIATAQGT